MIASLNFKPLAERWGQEATWVFFTPPPPRPLTHGAELPQYHPILQHR